MTSVTDNRTTELREKLDELGIKHFDYDKGSRTQTMWESPEGMRHFTYETNANPAKTAKLVIEWFPTPEQAIAATLGSGTCEVEYVNDWMGWHCLKCDNIKQGLKDQKPNYCPNCGRKVKE